MEAEGAYREAPPQKIFWKTQLNIFWKTDYLASYCSFSFCDLRTFSKVLFEYLNLILAMLWLLNQKTVIPPKDSGAAVIHCLHLLSLSFSLLLSYFPNTAKHFWSVGHELDTGLKTSHILSQCSCQSVTYVPLHLHLQLRVTELVSGSFGYLLPQ